MGIEYEWPRSYVDWTAHCALAYFFQMLMNVRLTLMTVMPMPHVLTLMDTLSVHAMKDTQGMEEIAHVCTL